MPEDHSHHPLTGRRINAAEQQAQDAQYFRCVLHELIDMGVDLARQVHRQAQPLAEAPKPANDHDAEQSSDPSPAPLTQDPTIAFERVARTIRRTIILARKLSEPVKATRFGAAHHMAARKRNIRVVDDHFQPNQPEDDLSKCLDSELQERLDALDLEDDPDDRPIADIIADICCDLGIADLPDTHPQKHRILADIANLASRAAIIVSGKSETPHDAPDMPALNVVAMHSHQRTEGDKSTDPPQPSE